jgi:hypothetical protein
MNRDSSLLVIAAALIAFGVYRALYLPGMLTGASTPLLFACFLLQAVFGIAAGICVWRGAGPAPLLIVLLGSSIALTGLIEIALGVVAWLYALLGAVVALVVALLLARYVAGKRGAPA